MRKTTMGSDEDSHPIDLHERGVLISFQRFRKRIDDKIFSIIIK